MAPPAAAAAVVAIGISIVVPGAVVLLAVILMAWRGLRGWS